MKRKLLLAGSILGVIGSSILSIVYIIALIFVLQHSSMMVGTVVENVFAIIYLALLAISAIISLIFSILSISQSLKPLGKLSKAILITSLVFDTIVCVDAFSMLNAVLILIAMPVLNAGYLKLADFCIEKKRISEDKLKRNVDDMPQNDVNKNCEENSLELKLIRLDNMRKEGLINDEDFLLLKKDLINKELSK